MRLFVATFAAGAIAGAFALGIVAIPERVWAQGIPSYGRPGPAAEETIHGRIESVAGPFTIVVRDDRGFLDSVTLRQGTIINPRGLRLAVGMTVTIVGFNAGASFSAVEIDVPYAYDEAGPLNYGAYDYDYGLASAIDLGLGFISPPVVQVAQPVVVVKPGTGVPREIEHPTPGHPIRHPLDDPSKPVPSDQASPAPSDQASPAPSVGMPSYAVPLTSVPGLFGRGSGPVYRGVPGPGGTGAGATGSRSTGAGVPQSRVPLPQSRGSTPDYQPAPPPPARSEPARSEPVRTEPARSEPARSEPARSEPARSEPARSEPSRPH
jgi:hypothetical protein